MPIEHVWHLQVTPLFGLHKAYRSQLTWLSAVVVLGLDGFYVLPSIGFSEVIIFLGLMKLKNKIIAKK